MIKNMVFKKHLKRFLAIGLVLVGTITLSGCSGSSDGFPVGGLDAKATYATNGQTVLTVEELYKELRHNSVGFLTTKTQEAAFAEYISKVDLDKQDQKDKMAEFMLNDIFGTFDDEELEDMKASDVNIKVNTYMDKVYLEGYNLIAGDFDFKDNTPSIANMIETKAFKILEKKYTLAVAQYLFAYEELEKSVKEQNEEAEKDEDVSPYFTDANIANHYDSNFNYTDDVNAVIVRFVDGAEADEVFRKFGIKAYKGEWYQIQLPVNDQGTVDVSKWDKESDYNTYYDQYEISTGALNRPDNTIKNLGNDNETILKIFIEMYNYIYTYRNPITYTSSVTSPSTAPKDFLTQYYKIQDIIKNDAKDENAYDTLVAELNGNAKNQAATTFTKDKLDSYSSSLTNYVNETLRTTAEKDEDTEEDLPFIQYTATSRNYGSSNYVVFKLSETKETDFYTKSEDEDGNTVYEFDDSEAGKELYDKIVQELFDQTLSNSYINTKVTERMEDVTIDIYDTVIDLLYSQANTAHTGSRGSSDDLVALIKFDKKETKITVKELYEFLENIYGPSTANSVLLDKFIETTEHYTDLDENYDTYKQIVSTTLAHFANDAYASYGYPASMGKYNFMLLYFKSANVDKAISYLQLQDAKAEYFLDIAQQDVFFDTMNEYYAKAYENYYSLTLTNILVYADFDEDGTPDENYFTTKDEPSDLIKNPLSVAEKQALAKELVADLITYAKKSTVSLAASFNEVVAEYNSSSRITPSTDPEYSGSVEHKWAKYRQAGLLISTNSLGEFNNTTSLNEEMQDLVKDLYNDSDNEIIYDNSFSGAYLIDDANGSILTEDGYNVLLVTAGNGKVDIDFENEETELYEKVPVKINDNQYKIYNLASTGIKATDDQIEVYCREFFTLGSSASLPTSANAHLAAYLQPALAKFNSEASQLMLMIKELNVTSTDETFNDRLNKFVELKQRAVDGYDANANSNFVGFWESAIYTGGNN